MSSLVLVQMPDAFDEHDNVLNKARVIAEERHPGASSCRHAAFANSVAYLVTGFSGGFGGPSVREHVASGLIRNGKMIFERAVEALIGQDGLIFGPLTDLHRFCWENEHCFNDDPADVAELG